MAAWLSMTGWYYSLCCTPQPIAELLQTLIVAPRATVLDLAKAGPEIDVLKFESRIRAAAAAQSLVNSRVG